MDLKIDLKLLIPILSAAIIFGGFYYTTEHRLSQLELEISSLKEDLAKIRKVANKKNK